MNIEYAQMLRKKKRDERRLQERLEERRQKEDERKKEEESQSQESQSLLELEERNAERPSQKRQYRNFSKLFRNYTGKKP